MRGHGLASSAITIVTALTSGQGCAAAIDLGVAVEAELVRTAPGLSPGADFDPGTADTPLARASLALALRTYAPLEAYDARLHIFSDIPAGQGLKSSSAVGAAVIAAVADARGLAPPAEEIARRAAGLARGSGQSATGAFDDALAALEGGVVLTDNAADRVLGRATWATEDRVLLYLPGATHPPTPELRARFAGTEAEGRAAIALAEAGEYLRALDRNTRTVERCLALPYAPLRRKAAEAGAVGSGVCGAGPSLALLVPASRLEAVRSVLPSGGTWIETSLRPPRGPVHWMGAP